MSTPSGPAKTESEDRQRLPNPFKLLASFDKGDRLFGRDADLTLLLARIASDRITLLFAGSGVGKTSFLDAKVVPVLEQTYVVVAHRNWITPDPLGTVRTQILERVIAPHSLTGQDMRSQRGIIRRALGASNAQVSASGKLNAAALLADESSEHKPLLVVLDQFEELLRTGVTDRQVRKFVGKLTFLVRAYPVRVIIALREDHLESLSVFDNRIRDIFGNFCRLKRPTREDALGIIRDTVARAGASMAEPEAKLLVRDLAIAGPTFESSRHGASSHRLVARLAVRLKAASTQLRMTARAVGHRLGLRRLGATPVDSQGRAPKHEPRYEFVSPPFLQIACYGLWDKSGPTSEGEKFPTAYKSGDAQLALSVFCQQQLDRLNFWRRYVASKCFEYLVTNRGAKMPQTDRQLAKLLWLPASIIRSALNKLVEQKGGLLASWPSATHTTYALYHDVFASEMQSWAAESRLKRRIRLAFVGLLLLVVVPWLVIAQGNAETREVLFPQALAHSAVPAESPFAVACHAADDLNRRPALGSIAFNPVRPLPVRALWHDYLVRQAQAAMKRQDRMSAMLYWIKARAVSVELGAPTSAEESELRLLVDDELLRVRAGFSSAIAAVEAKGNPSDSSVLLRLSDGQLVLWNADDGKSEKLPNDWEGRGLAEGMPTILAFGRDSQLKSRHVFMGYWPSPESESSQPPPAVSAFAESAVIQDRNSSRRYPAMLWDQSGHSIKLGNNPLIDSFDIVALSQSGESLAILHRQGPRGVSEEQSALQLYTRYTKGTVDEFQETHRVDRPFETLAFGEGDRLLVAGANRIELFQNGTLVENCSRPLPMDGRVDLVWPTLHGFLLESRQDLLGAAAVDRASSLKGRAVQTLPFPYLNGPLPNDVQYRVVELSTGTGCGKFGEPWDLPINASVEAVSTIREADVIRVRPRLGTPVLYNLASKQSLGPATGPLTLSTNATAVLTRPDGAVAIDLPYEDKERLLAISEDGAYMVVGSSARFESPTVTVRNVASNAVLATLTNTPEPTSFAWKIGGGGRVVSASSRQAGSAKVGGKVNLWPGVGATELSREIIDGDFVSLSPVDPTAIITSASTSAVTLVSHNGHEWSKYKLVDPDQVPSKPMRQSMFSSDGSHAAVLTQSNEAIVWKVNKDGFYRIGPDEPYLGAGPLFSLMTVARNGRVGFVRGYNLWAFEPGNAASRHWAPIESAVSALHFMDDGRVLLGTNDGQAVIWDVPKWRPEADGFDKLPSRINSFVVSHDREQIGVRTRDWLSVYANKDAAVTYLRTYYVGDSMVVPSHESTSLDKFEFVTPSAERVLPSTISADGRKIPFDLAAWETRLGLRIGDSGQLESLTTDDKRKQAGDQSFCVDKPK